MSRNIVGGFWEVIKGRVYNICQNPKCKVRFRGKTLNFPFCPKCQKENGNLKSLIRYYNNRDKILSKPHNVSEKQRILYNKLVQKWQKKDYKKNKVKWFERVFTYKYRKEIIAIIGNKCCDCGKPLQEIHHTKYKGLKKYHKDLKKYCKFLKPFCRKCHNKYERKKPPKIQLLY